MFLFHMICANILLCNNYYSNISRVDLLLIFRYKIEVYKIKIKIRRRIYKYVKHRMSFINYKGIL